MNLLEFLQDISFKGIELGHDGEKLLIDGSENLLTSDVIAQLKQHKTEILQLLRDRPDILNIYPLSYGQQSLWFLWQLAPKSAAYNVAFTCRICSPINVITLQKSLKIILDRHPQLRSKFFKQDNNIVQQIHQTQFTDFQQINTSTWREQELEQRVFQEYQQPFNIENDSIMRVRLFSCSQQEHILLVTIHHIAVDAWSVLLLIEELITVYLALELGVQPSLTPLKHSYIDYVRWQRELLTSTQGEKLWNYWQQKLAGELPVLNLPTDRPRPAIQTYNGASYNFKISQKLTEQLKKLAQAEGVTQYIVLLAAFQVLLYRYTGQEDILVGAPTSGRTQPEFVPLVGYFVDPVVMRANLSGNPSFQEFLTQVCQTVSEALAHQDFPFALLVERLQPQRDPSRSVIFQAAFNFLFQNLGQFEHTQQLWLGNEVDTEGFKLKPFEIPQMEGQFDLNLTMAEASSSLAGIFQYNTDLFDASTIERMAGHFVTLLEGIVANPQQKISQLPLLTQVEEHQLLVEWNSTRANYPLDKCIHQLFEEQVQHTPDIVAVVYENQQMTYQQLNCRANQLAHYLRSVGVGPEVLVSLCVERSLDMVVGLLGILKAGGAYVPLDPEYPTERLSFMLEDAQVGILLTQQKLIEKLPQHQAKLICLDSDAQVITRQKQENPILQVIPNNLAYIIYTSGSTGRPKGVMVTHTGLFNLAQAQIQTFGLQNLSRILQFASLSFDASIWEIIMALGSGATLYLGTKDSLLPGMSLIQLLRDYSITHITLPPSALAVLPVEELPALQTMIVAGEACSLKLITQWSAGRNFFNAYGPTEASICATVTKCTVDDKKISIGRPIANTQIYILDSNLQPVPIGVPAELHIGGEGLARGYLNRLELTADKFIPNPFSTNGYSRLYKTGDIARYLPSGNIEYLGRIDHQVKIRGFRIELGEIEAVLNQHPSVDSVVVATRVDTPGHQRLVAYIVPQNQSAPTISDLRQFLKTKLPNYMVPSAIVMLESLPLTPNGKVDRRALPNPDTRQLELASYFVPPRDTLELQLAQIWKDILNVHRVGVTDNFFDLGGHSLLAIRLMAQIQQQFEKELPLATLFKGATIEQLASLLRKHSDSLSWEPLVAIQLSGSKRPFFCVPGAGGNVLYFYNLARRLGIEQPFYGLQQQGIDGNQPPHTQVEDMAANYIQALQVVQPQGPYLLGGHCFGGYVAFEMAQQLHSSGQEVALLAILDSVAPIINEKPVEIDLNDAKYLTEFVSGLERLFGKNLSISYEYLQPLDPDRQLNYILERLKIVNIFPPDTQLSQIRGIVQCIKASLQANYVPQKTYPNQITVFRASEQQLSNDPTMGWDKFSSKPIHSYNVPGDHVTMLTEPHVQGLAEHLTSCISLCNQKHK